VARRKANGQFEKGYSGNPKGRPKAAYQEKYREAMRKECSLEDWRKIIRTAVARAKAGDNASRQWLSDHLAGKPEEYINTDITSNGKSLVIRYVNDWRNQEEQ